MNSYQEQIFNNGDAYFECLIADINNAKISIDIEIYLFKFDELGQKIIQALITAAKKNIKIRILVDGIGSHNWKGKIVEQLEAYGIKSKIFHPPPWNIGQFNRSVSNQTLINKFIYFLININYRTHRKIVIIDNKITHIGSRNFDKRHLSKYQGGANWRDTNVRIVNGPIENLVNSFNSIWNNKFSINKIQSKLFKTTTNQIIRLNDNRQQRRILQKQLLKKIAKAKTKIWITNAYFIPSKFLIKKIADASKQGVDVRILLPQKSDVSIIPWISEVFYEQLHKAGVRIFEYQPSILHAKTIIIDDWVMLGSSNLNHRSLLHDLEVDVVLTTTNSKNKIINDFITDLTTSQEILNPKSQQRFWLKRVIGRIMIAIKFFI